MLTKIADYLRIRNWFPLIMTNTLVALLFLALIGITEERTIAFLLFIVYQLIVAIYTGLLNSFAEKEQDEKAGKNTGLDLFSHKTTATIIIFAAITLVLLSLIFNEITLVIGLSVFLLSTFYTLKPVRLKEKGILGVVSAALLIAPLPFLYFASLTTINNLAIFFGFWLFAKQLLLEIFHQTLDYEQDKKTRVATFAVLAGQNLTKKTFQILFILVAAITILPVLIYGTTGVLITVLLALGLVQPLSHVFGV